MQQPLAKPSTYLSSQGQAFYLGAGPILNRNISPLSARGRAFEYQSPSRLRGIQGQPEALIGRSPDLRAAPIVMNQPPVLGTLSRQETIDLSSMNSLKTQLEAAKAEVNTWRVRFESLERKQPVDAPSVPEWESKLDTVVKENERLHKVIKEKMGTKSKYQEFEQKLLRATEELEKMNSFMEKREMDYEKKEEDWRREYGKLQEELQKKSQIIVEMDGRILHLNREIERISSASGQPDSFKQIEVLRLSVESLTRQNIDLERQLKNLAAERAGLEAKNGDSWKYIDICAKLEEQLRQVQNENEGLRRSRSSSSEHWQAERAALINSLRDGESKLKQLLDKTTAITNQKDQEIREWREKYFDCEKRLDEIVFYKTEIQRFQGIINSLENQIETLFSEKNSLQELLHDKTGGAYAIDSAQKGPSQEELMSKLKEQEKKVFELLEKNDAINDLLESSELRIRGLAQENSRLAEALAQKNHEFDASKDSKILENARLREMQENFTKLHNELEKLNKVLEARENEIAGLHSKNSELEGARLSMEENSLVTKTRVADYENKLRLIINRNDQLNDIIASQNEQLSVLKDRKDELVEADLQKIAIEELELQISSQKHSLEDANRHNLRLVETVEDLNQLISTNNKEIEIWRKKCMEVEGERSREIKELLSERSSLSGELKKYKEAILELDQQIQRLTEENHFLKEISSKVPQLEEGIRQMELHTSKFLEEANYSKLASQELYVLKQEVACQQQELVSKQQENRELESKLNLMIDENEKLLRYNEERVKDLEDLRIELNSYEQRLTQLSREAQLWQTRYGNLIGNVEHLKVAFEEYRQFQAVSLDRVSQMSENNKGAANSEVLKLNSQVSSLQRQLESLHDEKTVLIKTNIERRREIETLNYEIDDKSGDLLQLSTERDVCKRRSMNAEERLIKYEAEISSLKAQLTQYKSLYENSKQEITKLYDLLKSRKDDYERVADQLIRIEKELVQERKNRAANAGDFANSKDSGLESENLKLKNLFGDSRLELEEKDRQISKLLKELEDLNMKYREAVSLINSLEARLSSPPRIISE